MSDERLPSASSLPLAMACAASQVLPSVESAWAAGAAGTDKHAALAWRMRGPEATPETYDGDTAAWLDAIDDETLVPLAGAASEVAFAYDYVTGKARVLGSNLGRRYPETAPTEFVGSLDYVRNNGDSVTVVDLKTGMGDVPHPSRNAQLRFGALAAARWFGVDEARVGILHAPEGRTPWWTWATLDAFELDVVAGEMDRLAGSIGYARDDYRRGKTPRLRVGEHCGHCPARYGCPARVAMAKRLAGEPEDVVRDLKALLTPETARMALERWQAATKAMQEVGNALYAYASETPIALGDGRVWGPQTSEREVIDAEKAWHVLVEKYGADIARKAMTLETSKAGVERAMRAVREATPGAKLKSLNAEALAALRESGCIGKKVTKTFEAYSVEARALPAEAPQQEEAQS